MLMGDPELLAAALDAGIPSNIAHEILKVQGPDALQQAIDARTKPAETSEPEEG
jgi:hypothetical protein